MEILWCKRKLNEKIYPKRINNVNVIGRSSKYEGAFVTASIFREDGMFDTEILEDLQNYGLY